jgi:hypothetical protein
LLNFTKELGRYGAFGVRGFNVLVINELKQIRISNLKFSMVASLPLEYKEVL